MITVTIRRETTKQTQLREYRIECIRGAARVNAYVEVKRGAAYEEKGFFVGQLITQQEANDIALDDAIELVTYDK